MSYVKWLEIVKSHTDIQFLDINTEIAYQAVILPEHHKDPMDRMIIATAMYYQLDIASVDGKFKLYNQLDGKLLY